MISLGSIVVELLANTASFQSGMNKASYEGKKAAKEIHQSFSEMGNKIGSAAQNALASLGQFGAVAGELSRGLSEALDGLGKGSNGIALAATALGGLAAGAIAAAAGLLELGKSGAELVEQIDHVSQKTGISNRDLLAFKAAGESVGLGMDELVAATKRLSQALTNTGKGAAAQSVLRELGVTARDEKGALLEIADAFSKMENGPRKAADAVALFGKNGLALIPLLNQGRDGIDKWTAAVDRLGPVIGKEAVEANEKYRDSIGELSLAWDKLKVQTEQSTIPALSKLTSWFANNFQSIKAGLAGGFGAAAILKDQQAAQQALTDEVKKTSAAKDDQLRKQEALTASEQHSFEILKAGGTAAFALEQARQNLTDAIQAGLWKQASAIQSQLPGLQKAAELEAQRAARAKQLADSYASMQKFFDSGAIVKPLLKTPKADPTAGIEALFGPQLKKDPFEGAPDFGNPVAGMDLGKGLNLLEDTLNSGQKFIIDFSEKWKAESHGTEKSINADYDAQLAKLQGFLALGQVSEEQAKNVYLKIQKERFDGLKELREKSGTSTFKDAWTDLFAEIQASGKDFARSITADIGGAIQSLNQQLAQFVVTGKGLSLKSIGQSLEANLFGSVLRKAESGLFGSLGKMFGLGNGNKADGSSANNALWVQFSNVGGLSAAGVGSLPLGNIASMFGLGGSTTTGTTTAGSSSGGGFLSGIGSIFGTIAKFLPFLADGGDVQPGKAYVVGERRPELFVPRSAGTIVPSVSNGDSHKHLHIKNELHVHGVTDADGFKRSSGQIMNNMTRAQQRAASR